MTTVIRQLPKLFNSVFQHASDIHSYNTRYAAAQNLHKLRTARIRTKIGKQKNSFQAIHLWKELRTRFKELGEFA